MNQDKIISELIAKINFLTKRLDQTEKRVTNVEAINKALKQEITKLKQEITELKLENIELKACLNSNSRNSSKPPSSDGYKKKPAFPKKKNGK